MKNKRKREREREREGEGGRERERDRHGVVLSEKLIILSSLLQLNLTLSIFF